MSSSPSLPPTSLPPRRSSRLRALAFAAAAAILGVIALEGLAAVLEPHLFPYKRSVPLPAPDAPGRDAFIAEAARAHAGMDPEDAPWAGVTGIPLAADEARGWSLPPGTEIEAGGVVIRGNEVGMRGSDLRPPVEGDVRLLTLGDSSIFGDGVEEIDVFSSVATGLLAKAWSRRVVGIIGACPGHDSSQSLSTLRGFGGRIQPSWVVIGNLWSDVYRREETSADAHVYLPPVQGILRRSALYRLLWRSWSPWLNARKVRWIEDRGDVGGLVDERMRVPLPAYLANLRAMVAESERIGARPAFLILPAPMDLDALPVPDTVSQYRLGMKRVAEQAGAPVLDGPALFAERGATVAWFKDNVHPNAEGHFVLGQGLAELLGAFGPPPAGTSHYRR